VKPGSGVDLVERGGKELRREPLVKCLDTDFLVAILRGQEIAQRKMVEMDREGRHSTTAISAFELFYGSHKSNQRLTNVEKTKVLLERVDVLPFESGSSERAGEILAALSACGDSIDFRDAMIAGIATANGLTLVTRNKEHFARVKELEIELW
jgi:tRNA(fMet)-specific endonuclease VapC